MDIVQQVKNLNSQWNDFFDEFIDDLGNINTHILNDMQKDINNVIKVDDLRNYQLKMVLELFTRNDLRVLARKYNISQQGLKIDFVWELISNRNRFDHHLITIAMV